MRHRRRGRTLGRAPSHQRAMLRNLASSLFITSIDDDDLNTAKVKGRVVTTLPKAKEVRSLVERCITIARRTLDDQRKADALDTEHERNSEEWRAWRKSSQWNDWNQAVAPVLAARRRAIQLLGNKDAVKILFDEIAPRFEDRPGGYTRVVRLAKPRLGDAGTRAILEFVGIRDRDQQESVEAPAFETEDEAAGSAPVDEAVSEEASTEAAPEAGDEKES